MADIELSTQPTDAVLTGDELLWGADSETSDPKLYPVNAIRPYLIVLPGTEFASLVQNNTHILLAAGIHEIAGYVFNSLTGVTIQGLPGAILRLADGANTHTLRFNTSTKIRVRELEIDGNAANQATTGSSGGNGVYFEWCDDVRTIDCDIHDTAASGVRARNSNDARVIGGSVINPGYIPIYMGPSTTAGRDVTLLRVERVLVDWSMADPAVSNFAAISPSAVNSSGKTITDLAVIGCTIKQCATPTSGFCAGINPRNVKGFLIQGNHVYGAGLPYTCATGCEDGVIFGNFNHDYPSHDIFAGLYCLELGGGLKNVIAANNIFDGNGNADGVQDNGGSDNTTVANNIMKNVVSGFRCVSPTLGGSVGLKLLGNDISSSSHCINLKNTDGFKASGNTLNPNGTADGVLLVFCDNWSITDNDFKAPLNYHIHFNSTDAFAMHEGYASGNRFAELSSSANYVKNTLFAGSTVAKLVVNIDGKGTPEGSLASSPGSTWKRSDGAVGSTMYLKESAVDSTAWSALTGATPVSGTTTPTVVGTGGTDNVYSLQKCRYSVFGGYCDFDLEITLTTLNQTGDLTIVTGIPFNVTIGYQASIDIGTYSGFTLASGHVLFATIAAQTSIITLKDQVETGSGATSVLNTEASNTMHVVASGRYKCDPA